MKKTVACTCLKCVLNRWQNCAKNGITGSQGRAEDHQVSSADKSKDPYSGKDDHHSKAGIHQGRSGVTGRERTERLTVASSETVSLAMTGQAERSWTASMAMTGQFVSSEVDAAASGGSAADTATSEADSWTGEASEADSWIEEASWAQYAAHTLKMVTTITGRAAEGGRTSKMAGLESADVTGMPAACTDISGVGFGTLTAS